MQSCRQIVNIGFPQRAASAASNIYGLVALGLKRQLRKSNSEFLSSNVMNCMNAGRSSYGSQRNHK